MKRLTSIILEMAPALTLVLTVPCCLLAFLLGMVAEHDASQKVERTENQSLLSETSHLRNLNWLLARQIEREKGGEQLNPSSP